MPILGLFVFNLFIVGSLVIWGGDLANFVDIPSIFFILGPVAGVLIARHGLGVFKKLTEPQVLRSISLSAIAIGILGTLIGAIMVLSNLGDPSKIGPALAVSLLTLLYALMTYLFAFMLLKGQITAQSEGPYDKTNCASSIRDQSE